MINELITWFTPAERMPKEADDRFNDKGECELLLILPDCYVKWRCVGEYCHKDKTIVPSHWNRFLYLRECEFWAYMPKGENK